MIFNIPLPSWMKVALLWTLFFPFQSVAQYAITPPNGTCLQYTPIQSYTFTVSGPAESTGHWKVKGDLALLSSTLTTVTVRANGYGKGRISYFKGDTTCETLLASVDVFKSFSVPDSITISGPSCVKVGVPATFSVKPLVSSPQHLGSEIGIDSYSWTLNGLDITTMIGVVYSYASGDKSSFTVTLPDAFPAPVILAVSLGKCGNPVRQTLQVGTIPRTPVFSGTLPSCIPTSSTTPFSLSVVADSNVTYSWVKSAGSNWSISAPTTANGLNTVTVTPDGNASEISVVASILNGCESAVNKLYISRQLTAGTNAIVGGTGCLTVGTPVTYTLSNPPSNSTFTWSAPSGWTPTTATLASATFTPTSTAQPGSITVKTSTCASGISITPILATTQGKIFTIANLDCGLFRVTSPGFVKTGATYQWYLNGVYKGSSSGNANAFTFDPWTGQQTISVRISKASPDCLAVTSSLPNIAYGCSPSTLQARRAASARQETEVRK